MTKWTTLSGVSLSVISSTVLYLNVGAWAIFPDTFFPNPWLHPLVFMANLDSILNDFGMVLASGMLTSASSRNSSKRVSITPSSSSQRVIFPAAVNITVNVARSQLQGIASILNKGEFIPPQEQPGGIELARIARVLQEGSFQESAGDGVAPKMDDGVAGVIDQDFGPTARAFFGRCVKDSVTLAPEMRDQYHGVRRGHLLIYKDTLEQVRQEPQFGELKRRADKLVGDAATLERPQVQSTKTISGLYRTGEAVSQRFKDLMALVGSKTGATFHEAPRKGLVRICEKLALTSGSNNWKPERVCDAVRGALECNDFVTMINVLRLLRDLDSELLVTGETGGISVKICITRSKNRFGTPTSGGWADILLNFYFEDDAGKHICEVQLVHSQLFSVRKNMGAHKTYSIFRAALELLEMLGLDPEEGVDVADLQILESLVWGEQPIDAKKRRSLAGDRAICRRKVEVELLEAEVAALNAKVEVVIAEAVVKNSKVEALVAQNDAQVSKLGVLLEEMHQRKASIARL